MRTHLKNWIALHPGQILGPTNWTIELDPYQLSWKDFGHEEVMCDLEQTIYLI